MTSVTAAINAKIQATQMAQRRENEVAQATAEAQKTVAEAHGLADSKLLIATAQGTSHQDPGRGATRQPQPGAAQRRGQVGRPRAAIHAQRCDAAAQPQREVSPLATVSGNTVTDLVPDGYGQAYGIYVDNQHAEPVALSGNQVTGPIGKGLGIHCANSAAIASNNTVTGFPTPMVGCSDGGGNGFVP